MDLEAFLAHQLVPNLNLVIPKCQKHPSYSYNFYHVSLEKQINLFCEECLKNQEKNYENLKRIDDLLSNSFLIMSQTQKNLQFFKDQFDLLENEHLKILKNFRNKIISSLNDLEKNAYEFFEHAKYFVLKDLDLEILNNTIEEMKQINSQENFKYRIGILSRKFGFENEFFGEIREKVGLFGEVTSNLNNEINITFLNFLVAFRANSLAHYETNSEQLMIRSQQFKSYSFLDNNKNNNAIHETLKMVKYPVEINSNFPFAKDIALIGQIEKSFLFATCSNDEKIRLWNLGLDACEFENYLNGHTDWVNRIIYSSELNVMLSSSRDKTIRLWDIETLKCLEIYLGHTDSVFGLTFFNDLPLFASGSYDKTIKLWGLNCPNCKYTLELENSIYEIRSYNINEVGPCLVAGDSQGNLYFIFLIDGICLKKRNKIKAHEGCILRICYIKSGGLIATSANKDKMLKLWNSSTMNIVHHLNIHDEGGISGLFYDEVNDILISSGKDNSIKIIKCDKFDILNEYKDSFTQFGGVVWIPKKNVLISCGGKKINSNVKMTINIRYF